MFRGITLNFITNFRSRYSLLQIQKQPHQYKERKKLCAKKFFVQQDNSVMYLQASIEGKRSVNSHTSHVYIIAAEFNLHTFYEHILNLK